jgi:ribosomal protein S18 acetylase RimI-like enzyme
LIGIRAFDAGSDTAAVEALVQALQDFGRAQDTRLPAGAAMSSAYLASLRAACERHAGRIFVAELDQAVIGYACVLSCMPTVEPADGVAEEARVVDLFVSEAARGRGVGQRLLAAAEAHAVAQGARWLRVAVFAWNDKALSLYDGLGFSRHEVVMEKALTPAASAP